MTDRIRLDRWTVTSGSNVVSRAAVVLHAGSHDWQASAEGTGAVDALFRAVDAALREVLGGSPLLLGYDVHALAEGPDAEGAVSVRIAPPPAAEAGRSDGRFDGESASVNTIAASVEAYVEALNAMLASDAWTGAARAAGDARDGDRPDAETEPTSTEFDAEADVDAMEWFNR
jgi:2-isopropylmalate synthase